MNRRNGIPESAATKKRTHLVRNSSSTPRRYVCYSGSGGQIVAMMQAAESRHGYDLAPGLRATHRYTTGRRSLSQCKMSSVLVIIPDILIHKTFQMAFIENDHMVEQVSAATPYPALRDTILPRTSEAGPFGLDAEALYRIDDFFIKLCATVKDQITGRGVVRECLAQLLDDPGAGRVFGHIAVQDAPPIMGNDEETVENAESERRNGEEIHCSDGFTMIAQKGRPPLCRIGISRRFPHPALHGSFGEIEAQHLQLTVNSWRSPG